MPTPTNSWRKIPPFTGVADARIQQSAGQPTLRCQSGPHPRPLHRRHAATLTDSLVVNLDSSSQVAPTYWLKPEERRHLPIALLTPHIQGRFRCRPCGIAGSTPAGAPTTVLGGIADIRRRSSDASVRNTTSLRWWRSTRPPKGAISRGLRHIEKHRSPKRQG